jgi:hypothetical protein
MLFTINCDGIGPGSRGEASCIVVDGEETDDASGLEPACTAGDSGADAEVITRTSPQSQPGGTVIVNTNASSDPASAAASGSHVTCYVATQAANLSASLFIAEFEFNEFCVTGGGYSEVVLAYEVTKNGLDLGPIVEASAQLDCAAGTVSTTGGYLQCSATGVAGRFACNGDSTTFFDITPIAPGDELSASLTVQAYSELTAVEPLGDGSLETEVTATYFLFGSGLNEDSCPRPESCSSNGDCGGEQVCLDLLCLELDFGDPADATATFFPANPDPGQVLNLSFTYQLRAGDLMPHRLELAVPEEAIDLNGPLSAGMTLSTCNLDGRPVPIRVLESLDEVVADADGDGLPEAGEPTAKFGPDGQGAFRVDVEFADPPLVYTIPKDVTLSCAFSSLFLAGEEGRYSIDFVAISIDPDTGRADDGAGAAPLVRTGVAAELVVGDPPPACGDADGSGAGAAASRRALRGQLQHITASDALRVLRAAVGTVECDECVCDVDSSSSVTAGDALLVLRAAVGLDVTLDCPGC